MKEKTRLSIKKLSRLGKLKARLYTNLEKNKQITADMIACFASPEECAKYKNLPPDGYYDFDLIAINFGGNIILKIDNGCYEYEFRRIPPQHLHFPLRAYTKERLEKFKAKSNAS